MPHEGTTNITSNDRRSRRQFLTGVAAARAGLALGCVDRADMLAPLVRPRSNAQLVGASADGGFDHVIGLMMENRSFDHMMGWVPGADGRQGGLRYVDRDGIQRLTHKL